LFKTYKTNISPSELTYRLISVMEAVTDTSAVLYSHLQIIKKLEAAATLCISDIIHDDWHYQ
jgi:hypothetical protein